MPEVALKEIYKKFCCRDHDKLQLNLCMSFGGSGEQLIGIYQRFGVKNGSY